MPLQSLTRESKSSPVGCLARIHKRRKKMLDEKKMVTQLNSLIIKFEKEKIRAIAQDNKMTANGLSTRSNTLKYILKEIELGHWSK